MCQAEKEICVFTAETEFYPPRGECKAGYFIHITDLWKCKNASRALMVL